MTGLHSSVSGWSVKVLLADQRCDELSECLQECALAIAGGRYPSFAQLDQLTKAANSMTIAMGDELATEAEAGFDLSQAEREPNPYLTKE